jgi:hypothetical protein
MGSSKGIQTFCLFLIIGVGSLTLQIVDVGNSYKPNVAVPTVVDDSLRLNSNATARPSSSPTSVVQDSANRTLAPSTLQTGSPNSQATTSNPLALSVSSPPSSSPSENSVSTSEHDNHSLPCSVERYSEYYSSNFSSTEFPFTATCLQSLVESNPANMHLRVGLVRANYEHRPAPTRHVVFHCRQGCGGIGDRIRSAINSFYLALAMNATFTIDMELPVHWEDFFRGLNHNYETTAVGFFEKFALTAAYQSSSDFSINEQLFQQKERLVTSNFGGESFDSKVVILKDPLPESEAANVPLVPEANRNQDYSWYHETDMEHELFGKHIKDDKEVVLLSGMTFRMEAYKKNLYAEQFWSQNRLKDLGRAERSFIFFRLFMPYPSDSLKNAMTSYIDRLQGRFVVGMQIRLGGTVTKEKGGWVDPHRHGPMCVQCMAEKARELCHTSTLGCTIWATSDTEAAIEEIQSTFVNDTAINVLVSSGPLTHIDRSRFQTSERIQDNMRTFVDWFIMAECSDAFVLSRSGFGEHASWFNVMNETNFKPSFQFRSDSPCLFDEYRSIQNRFSAVEYRRRMR